MLFLATTFLTISAFLTTSLASPLTFDSRAPSEYKLQTKVVNGKHNDTGSNKNNLYLYSYHTGAGLSDAVLAPNGSLAVKGFLNGTIQQFDLNSPGISWWMWMGGDINYAAWEPVQIAAVYGPQDGFTFNATGLQWNTTYEGFGGWLACDWFHSTPQLFWLNQFYVPKIPSSCSKVDLVRVPV